MIKKKKVDYLLCFFVSQNTLVSKWEQEKKTTSSHTIPTLKGYTFHMVGPQGLAKTQNFQFTKKSVNLILG